LLKKKNQMSSGNWIEDHEDLFPYKKSGCPKETARLNYFRISLHCR
jgi:hypothetical protein